MRVGVFRVTAFCGREIVTERLNISCDNISMPAFIGRILLGIKEKPGIVVPNVNAFQSGVSLTSLMRNGIAIVPTSVRASIAVNHLAFKVYSAFLAPSPR